MRLNGSRIGKGKAEIGTRVVGYQSVSGAGISVVNLVDGMQLVSILNRIPNQTKCQLQIPVSDLEFNIWVSVCLGSLCRRRKKSKNVVYVDVVSGMWSILLGS